MPPGTPNNKWLPKANDKFNAYRLPTPKINYEIPAADNPQTCLTTSAGYVSAIDSRRPKGYLRKFAPVSWRFEPISTRFLKKQ